MERAQGFKLTSGLFLAFLGYWLLIVGFAIHFLPFVPTFPYAHDWLQSFGPRMLTTLAHFDGVHYLTIARQGYEGTGLIQAFFPLYPLIVSWLVRIGMHPIGAGVLISSISCFVGLLLTFRLTQQMYDAKIAKRTIWLLLAFPSSFFFIMMYSEGLFLLLIIATLLAAHNKRWWWAGLLGGLASATRLVGIALVPYLLMESLNEPTPLTKGLRIFLSLLPLAGLLSYMWYLAMTFGEPLLFVHVQESFGTARQTSSLVAWPQVVWRYMKMIASLDLSPILLRIIQEALVGVLGLVILIIAWFDRLVPRSMVLLGLCMFLIPTLTGTFSSLPRYVLPILPLYWWLSLKLSPAAFRRLIVLFVILQTINLIWFTQGIFVS